jgi:hypothetical protein
VRGNGSLAMRGNGSLAVRGNGSLAMRGNGSWRPLRRTGPAASLPPEHPLRLTVSPVTPSDRGR